MFPTPQRLIVWKFHWLIAILSSMIHIGLDSRLTYYRMGGISAYIKRLMSALALLDTENHYTIFHSRKESAAALATMPDRAPSNFRRTPLWTPAHHRYERLALSLELARFHLDVLHSPDFIPPYHGAKRHVITVHDLTFLHYPQYLTDDSRRYYNDQIEAAVQQADHIMVVSDSAKRDLITLLSVPESKLSVQPHGVDHQRYRPLEGSVLKAVQQHFELPDEPYILFVGTIEPRKNITGLLHAYRELRTRLSHTPPLVLVGHRGWLADKIVEQIETTTHVYWIQDAEDNDMPALYNLAKMLVLPSFYEGFGLPALEAMACGVIPIVSNRSALPEVVGEVGLQINPDDPSTLTEAMFQALTADKAWIDAQRHAALQRAAGFTWAQSAQIARSVYEEVAAKQK